MLRRMAAFRIRKHKKTRSTDDTMKSFMESSEFARILKNNEVDKGKDSIQQFPDNSNPPPSQQPATSASTYQLNVVNGNGGLDVYDMTPASSQQQAAPASTTTAASDDDGSTTTTTTTKTDPGCPMGPE